MLTTFFVDDDAAPGGDGAFDTPFQSIQAAIDAAAASPGNDTIEIAAGIYREALTITDPDGHVALLGASGDRGTVVLENPGQVDSIEIVGSSAVSIANLTLSGGLGTDFVGLSGIYVHDSVGVFSADSELSVSNVVIKDFQNSGIVAQLAGDVTVTDSELTGNFNGLYTSDVGVVTLTDVAATNNRRDGAQVNGALALNLSGGFYDDNNIHGLFSGQTTDVDIAHASFSRNGDNGVDIRGAVTVDATNIQVNENGSLGQIDGFVVAGSGSRVVTLTDVNASNNTGAGIGLRSVSYRADLTRVTANHNGFVGLAAPNVSILLTVQDGQFNYNTLQGMNLVGLESAVIDNVVVQNNGSADNGIQHGGGGIRFSAPDRSATFELTNSTISGNVSPIAGGGLLIDGLAEATLDNVQVIGNSAVGPANGGGIAMMATVLQSFILNSTISGNDGASGGGLFYALPELETPGMLWIVDTTIDGNTAAFGGGVYHINQNLRIRRSAITNNSTDTSFGGGGGLYVRGETFIENSTISGNHSAAQGGGIAVRNNPFEFRLFYSTLVNNTADRTGGGLEQTGNANRLLLGNSLIAQNTAIEGSPDVAGVIETKSFNLIGDATGSTGFDPATDLLGTTTSPIDPLIGPLADNGGPTQTHALLPGSPAIDAVGNTQLSYPQDQRQVPRPQGVAPDIGAFELQPDLNDLPVAQDQTLTLAEDTQVGGTVIATDADGDSLIYEVVTPPQNAQTFGFSSNGSFGYAPAANFNGIDFFTFRATDGRGYSNVATVTIEVLAVNDRPVATPDSYTLDEDTVLTVGQTHPGVLANDVDVDGDPLAAILVADPENGVLQLSADGTFTYVPNANFHGTDQFTYVASDGELTSSPVTVTLTVLPISDPPTAVADAVFAEEDLSAVFDLLANDFDVDGDDLRIDSLTAPENGSLVLNEDGTVTYTPVANFHGTDTFTYTIADTTGLTSTATVTVTVNPVNDAPVAQDAELVLPENSAVGTVVGKVQASDVDGDELTYIIVSGNESGAFAITNDGTIIVNDSEPLDFETTPSFHLTVTVGDGELSAAANVNITLTDVDETLPVVIDIVPGDPQNLIQIGNNKSIEVAIFSSSSFDATQIDINTLRFGATGTEDSLLRRGRHQTPQYQLTDLDGDGRLDLVVKFDATLTGLSEGDTTAILTGSLIGGNEFTASDDVTVSTSSRGNGNNKGNVNGKGNGRNK